MIAFGTDRAPDTVTGAGRRDKICDGVATKQVAGAGSSTPSHDGRRPRPGSAYGNTRRLHHRPPAPRPRSSSNSSTANSSAGSSHVVDRVPAGCGRRHGHPGQLVRCMALAKTCSSRARSAAPATRQSAARSSAETMTSALAGTVAIDTPDLRPVWTTSAPAAPSRYVAGPAASQIALDGLDGPPDLELQQPDADRDDQRHSQEHRARPPTTRR